MTKTNNKIEIYLTDKRNGAESEPVNIEEVIYNQHEIEFVFPDYEDEYGIVMDATLPYKDFLFFCEDYDVHIRVNSENFK